MNKEDYTTLYLCNGENPECPRCGICKEYEYRHNCYHTSNPEAAIGDICEEPWKHPDRFKCIIKEDGKMLFFEKFLADRLYKVYEGVKSV